MSETTTAAPAVAPAPAPAPAAAPPASVSPPVAFADTLPEDIRAEAAFKDIKDLGGLAKSYLNAQRMIGGDPASLLRLPTAPDAPEWDQVYAKLGRPDAPEKYALAMPDAVPVDSKLKAGFQDTAHKAGLNPRQAQALLDWWNAEAGSARTAAETAQSTRLVETVAALKTEWGAAYDQNLTLAKSALDHYGGEKLAIELDANGLGNSPELARVLAKLGAGLREDGLIGRAGDVASALLSPTEAQQQINALRASAEFKAAATNKTHPQHVEMTAKLTRLYQMAHPGER